jgi:hypothetical protein
MFWRVLRIRRVREIGRSAAPSFCIKDRAGSYRPQRAIGAAPGAANPALEGTSGERWHGAFRDACLPTSAPSRSPIRWR